MESNSKKSIVIIGGGPAAMMLACTLDPIRFDVTIVEKGKAIGRKFLVAGKGGFNLTHSEDIESLIQKYDGPSFLIDSLRSFNNRQLREWLNAIGIETYIGSSKRVFPIKGIKPIEVLKAIQAEMDRLGVNILTEHIWNGSMLSDEHIILNHNDKEVYVKADKIVFAMGGGSWKVTGSDGSWIELFKKNRVKCIPFRASNCVMKINWPERMKVHFGKPIKNLSITYRDKMIKGELMVTEKGIEGSPAYALSYDVGKELEQASSSIIYMDLKPSLSIDKILEKLKSKKKITSILKNDLALSSSAIALVKSVTSREEFNDSNILASKIKSLPLEIIGLGEIDEAISTVGGVSTIAISDHMELVDFPNHYVIGEMIDWNAPTGGYLLQGCFSMGRRLGVVLNEGSTEKI